MTMDKTTTERSPEESRALRCALIQKTLESLRELSERELRNRMLDPALVRQRLAEMDQAKSLRRSIADEG